MSINNKKLIRDAMGSPIPQFYNDGQGIFVPTTNGTGDASNVDFTKIKLIRDALGSTIPQYFDVTQNKFIPTTSNGGGGGGKQGPPGDDGESAYQIALDNGFVGTEVEWLASLKGAVEIQSKEIIDYGNTYPMGLSVMRVSDAHYTAWRSTLGAGSSTTIVVLTNRLSNIVTQNVYAFSYTTSTQLVGALSVLSIRSSRAVDGNNTWNNFVRIFPTSTPTFINPNGTYKIKRDVTMEGPDGLSMSYTPLRFTDVSKIFGSYDPVSIWSNIVGNQFTPRTDLRFNGQWFYECTLTIAMDFYAGGNFMAMVRFCIYNNQTDADNNNFSNGTVYDVFLPYRFSVGTQHMQFYMPPMGGYNTILKVYMTSELYIPENNLPWWTDYNLTVKLIGSNNNL